MTILSERPDYYKINTVIKRLEFFKKPGMQKYLRGKNGLKVPSFCMTVANMKLSVMEVYLSIFASVNE